jgi:hypothetical protein
MSAPVFPGYAESGDCSERKEDRTQNEVTPTPGEAGEEEGHGAEQNKVARLDVHSGPQMEGWAQLSPIQTGKEKIL